MIDYSFWSNGDTREAHVHANPSRSFCKARGDVIWHAIFDTIERNNNGDSWWGWIGGPTTFVGSYIAHEALTHDIHLLWADVNRRLSEMPSDRVISSWGQDDVILNINNSAHFVGLDPDDYIGSGRGSF